MCTPYMEAVTAGRFAFEYRYPNIVNQDQEQRVSINKTRETINVSTIAVIPYFS